MEVKDLKLKGFIDSIIYSKKTIKSRQKEMRQVIDEAISKGYDRKVINETVKQLMMTSDERIEVAQKREMVRVYAENIGVQLELGL